MGWGGCRWNYTGGPLPGDLHTIHIHWPKYCLERKAQRSLPITSAQDDRSSCEWLSRCLVPYLLIGRKILSISTFFYFWVQTPFAQALCYKCEIYPVHRRSSMHSKSSMYSKSSQNHRTWNDSSTSYWEVLEVSVYKGMNNSMSKRHFAFADKYSFFRLEV